jgi:hypothetical protein
MTTVLRDGPKFLIAVMAPIGPRISNCFKADMSTTDCDRRSKLNTEGMGGFRSFGFDTSANIREDTAVVLLLHLPRQEPSRFPLTELCPSYTNHACSGI